ncbi:serine/threonine-protein kinase [Terriglobus aquaticus]|uniref:Protein kinase domain-containing protein n=1 Tax=Terriglobus aquaticus TaxID=940139 RepID=A0ABW9KME7_9BACT|nr:serine/threonine-protein kinase [Terriglobus aquaticus]
MPDETELPSSLSSTSPREWEAAHWADLQKLYHMAAAAEPGERTRILRAATQDAELVTRVLELLEADAESEVDPASTAPSGPASPGRVGPYKLLRLIGSGGLGAVYLAQRVLGGAVQRCAVKVLSLHAAGLAMEARFLREQQIIATLDHPHITRMLDAGFSDEGQPFLAMEFVDGDTLTGTCDTQRMPIRDRIQLFLQVCDAVSYAHRMLVVHLDLKPSNILVSRSGEAKLLDFGTSKLVDPDSALTTTVLATPAYASPEQMRGQPVSTACDVYGLGAVLYELLSGERPWGAASGVLVMEHALREQEPPAITETVSEDAASLRAEGSAAALRQRLRGDLASIVARCLRSRPGDRYVSVDRLADDLRRYLQGRPVAARKRTLRYRSGKFLRRNWKPVVSVAAVLLALVTAATFGYVRQQQALRQGERAERMQNFLYSVLRLANTNYTGRPATTISEFLQLGVTALPEFIHDAADQRSARLSLGESMFDNSDFDHALPVLIAVRSEATQAGDIPMAAEATGFAGMVQSELGHYDEAARLLDEAMHLQDRKGVTAAQRLWIVNFYVSNRYNSGVRLASDAALLQRTLDESRKSAIPDRELSWALGNLATLYSRTNELDRARRAIEESLAIQRRQPYTSCDQSFGLDLLGDLDMNQGKDESALRNYQAGYSSIVACKGPSDLGSLELQVPLARLLVKEHRAGEAIQLLEPAIPVWRKSLPGNPEVGYTLTTLAQARMQQGDAGQAVSLAREALAAQSGKMKHNSAAMALTYSVLAKGLAGQGKSREALEASREADTIFASLSSLSIMSRQIQTDNHALLARLSAQTPHA